MTLPIKKLFGPNIDAAVWEFVNGDKKYYQVSLRKRFFNKKTNQFDEEKISLFDNQLLEFAALCRQTYDAIQGIRAANREQKPQAIEDSIPQEIDPTDVPF